MERCWISTHLKKNNKCIIVHHRTVPVKTEKHFLYIINTVEDKEDDVRTYTNCRH